MSAILTGLISGIMGVGGTLLGYFLHAREEGKRWARERRDRLSSELRARRQAAADEIWGWARRCYRLWMEKERFLRLDPGEQRMSLEAASRQYAEVAEANDLLLQGEPRVASAVLQLGWLLPPRDMPASKPSVEQIVAGIKDILERDPDAYREERKQAMERAYINVQVALRRFAGFSEMEEALAQSG